jgi:elongation factor 1-alpha
MAYFTLCSEAEVELLLPEEPDEGNTEYKLKFDKPSMDRVQHLTTQMIYRLNEGDGTAFYQVGVLDSGQVTGLTEEEIFETLLILFYMSTTLQKV